MSGGGFRASVIPANVKKTIQNIKEITGRHSDDEIYSMLKECSMDPNETAQKLLHQDSFHEVKRRRDRKKENQPQRETTDVKWRSSVPGRSGRGSYTPRYAAQDASIGRSTVSVNENGGPAFEKVGTISSPADPQEVKAKDPGSSVIVMANGPVGAVSGDTKCAQTSEVQSESVTEQPMATSLRQSQVVSGKRSNMVSSGRDARGKLGGKFHGAGKNQAVEVAQPTLSASSNSRPSSNYGSRTQQATGFQKVGPNKEWKPKPTNTNIVQECTSLSASDGADLSTEADIHTQPVQSTPHSEEVVNKLEKDLESLHVKDVQHVIIPNHIHVPESVRTGLSFGSFDSAFVLRSNSPSELENQTSPEPNSEAHQVNVTAVEELGTSQNTFTPAETVDYGDNSQSIKETPEIVSPSNDVVPSSSMPDSSDSKMDTTDVSQLPSTAPTTAGYNFGLMPAAVSSSLGTIEASETQARDVSRVPNFIVQQPVDPSSFYAQMYRSGVDNDGRISPFPGPGVAANYNGNLAILSAQASQSTPEGGNSMVLSTTPQTPLATQAAGVMPTSMGVTQQPMPIFRQPPGVHLPHYPPNFIPYAHYFSPVYVPPPTMHHRFIGNNAFPQQAQASGVYPGQPTVAGAATAVKYPISQYKPGSNTGNSPHMGVGGSYNQYVAPSVGFSPGPASTAGNSSTNEDFAASQFKENNMYIGQQTEGSTVWIPAAGREMSSLPVNSFYNLPPQGQHVSFGQGSFANLYHHPAQGVTPPTLHPLLQQSQPTPGPVDMVGATPPNMYQQPQHAQMNWPNNY